MRPYHILLVEDDAPVLAENARRLNAEGYEVSAAAALAEGRRAVRTQAPDLAVLDILLPDGSGLDLCRELRAVAPVPVLFLTSLDDRKQVVDGLRAGGDDYLTKPYHLDELVARVEALLRRVEEEGRRQGARRVLLNTFSFQAPGFYEKQGYRCFGALEPCFGTHGQYFFCKEL